MNNTKPLFIIGHKRSGTTHLAKILNMHKRIFIANESDILWILYQFYSDFELIAHYYDGPVGLNSTLKDSGHLLNRTRAPIDLFNEILLRNMKKSLPYFMHKFKSNLAYLGDQKPLQNIDPNVVDFTATHLPHATYIHLIRHPKDVVKSCQKFGPSNDGSWMWRGLSSDELLKRWVMVEKWVSREKERKRHLIIDLKYEDLIQNPQIEMSRVFDSLGLTYNSFLLKRIKYSISPNRATNHLSIAYTKDALEIMNDYNYHPV